MNSVWLVLEWSKLCLHQRMRYSVHTLNPLTLAFTFRWHFNRQGWPFSSTNTLLSRNVSYSHVPQNGRISKNRSPATGDALSKLPPFRWAHVYPHSHLRYIHDSDTAASFLRNWKRGFEGGNCCIGMDLEWKPNFVKGYSRYYSPALYST